jgi:hypothetical protein
VHIGKGAHIEDGKGNGEEFRMTWEGKLGCIWVKKCIQVGEGRTWVVGKGVVRTWNDLESR